MSELSNVEAANLVACLTGLATTLQFVHGNAKPAAPAVDQEISLAPPPAVQALTTCCHEVLASRKGVSSSFTQKLARSQLNRLLKEHTRLKLTYLELSIAYIEYLEYLRKSHIGMDRDELATSLTVYNMAVAYKDLIEADQVDIRKESVRLFQGFLLITLR